MEELLATRLVASGDMRTSLNMRASVNQPVEFSVHEPGEEALRSFLLFIRFTNGQTITITSSSCTPTGAPTTTTSVAPTTTTSTPATTTSTPAPGRPIQIDDVVLSDGNVALVTGTITCQAGHRYRMGVFITQDDTEGRGIVTANCTGRPQRFRVIIEVGPGPGFEDGAASARAVPRSEIPRPRGS